MDEFEGASADLNEGVITPNTLVTTMIDRMESMTIGIFSTYGSALTFRGRSK